MFYCCSGSSKQTQWKADQLRCDPLVFPGCVNRGANVVVGDETFLLLVNSTGPGRILHGEDSWRALSSLSRVGYSLLRTVLLEPSSTSDLWLEDIVEDQSLCHVFPYQRNPLSFCLHEKHQDNLCPGLVEDLLTQDGGDQTVGTLGSDSWSTLHTGPFMPTASPPDAPPSLEIWSSGGFPVVLSALCQMCHL